MQRRTVLRVYLEPKTESYFGLSVPADAPEPKVGPLQVLSGGNLDFRFANWKEPDGNRVFGWYAKPKPGRVNDTTPPSRLVDFALIGGEIEWTGDGAEMVTATVPPKISDEKHSLVQVGILREPGLKPQKVTFAMRNENSGYADATGSLHREYDLADKGLIYLSAEQVAFGSADDSALSKSQPHLLYAWNMKNKMDYHARVGRITAA
jgi:hypothetical protein